MPEERGPNCSCFVGEGLPRQHANDCIRNGGWDARRDLKHAYGALKGEVLKLDPVKAQEAEEALEWAYIHGDSGTLRIQAGLLGESLNREFLKLADLMDRVYRIPGPVETLLEAVKGELVLIAAPEADRVRLSLVSAAGSGSFEVIRREGHQWSGSVGRLILELADAVETHTIPKGN